jgi:UDP-N-acetylmuramoyl-tripeptide--D-alanyl-D-alanine ligase
MNQPKHLLRYRRAKIRFISRLLDHYVHQVQKKHQPVIIAVTGTIGKTSAKVAIAQLLATRNSVYVECNNYNSDRMIRLNFFGLASPDRSRRLTHWVPILLEVRRRAKNFPYDIVVLEMAESRHASLKKFIAKLRPDIAVVTGVTPVHLAYFKTLDKVVTAVWSLASLCKTVIYNADFSELSALSGADPKNSYGLKEGATRAVNMRKGEAGKLSVVVATSGKKIEAQTQLIGTQSVYALAAAVAVAHKLGWKQSAIKSALAAITPVPGRLQALKGIHDTLLLDDSFNASPVSMRAAVDTLATYSGKKIAVLGSMNELADDTQAAHEEIGRYVVGKVDYLITIGSIAKKHLASAALEAGMDEDRVISFNRANQAGAVLREFARPNATFLFKGSQGAIYIEEAIKFVLENPHDPQVELVRQDRAWKRRKKGYFAEEAMV